MGADLPDTARRSRSPAGVFWLRCAEAKTLTSSLPTSSRRIRIPACPINVSKRLGSAILLKCSNGLDFTDLPQLHRASRGNNGMRMAEASSSRLEPKTLVEEFSADDETRPSTSSATRRHSHYDYQRIGRRSRPTSGSTPATVTSRGKRRSQQGYDEPRDFENLDEVAAPPPVDPQAEQAREARGDDLEDAQARGQTVEAKRSSTNATQNGKQQDRVRKRTSASTDQQKLSETAVGPPVEPSGPSSSSSTTAYKRRLRDGADRGDAVDEESVAAPPFVQRLPQDYLHNEDDSKEVPRLLTELYTISYLIFFSIFGTLSRLGVQWLTFYPGAPIVTPVIWANFGGSIFMGFLAEDQGLFGDSWHQSLPLVEKKSGGQSNITTEFEGLRRAERTKRKKSIPLYIGLATGFCGSFTSFSSFARDFFLALSNRLPTPVNHPYAPASGVLTTTSVMPRNGGYSFEAWAAVVIATIALSLGGLIFGAHMALFLESVTPGISSRFCRRFLDPSMVVLGWGCWLGTVFLCIWPPDRPGGPSSRGSWMNETWRGEVLFAIVFAPVGCLIRFYASLKLNGLVPAFPLGTFAVNMLGTAVEGVCWDVQHVGVGIMGSVGGGRVGCQVLQGIMDGFCGTLTTVSTWVAEINGLRRAHGYAYALGSVLGGLCLMVVIMGSVEWSVGWSGTACNTGYTSKIYG